MDVLLVDFRGTTEFLAQREHLERGCLFVAEPDPPPEPLTDLVLRARSPHGEIADLRVRVLQVYQGVGVVLELVDPPAARRVLDAWFEAASRCAPSSELMRVGWFREERVSAPSPAPYEEPAAACAAEEPPAGDAPEPDGTEGGPTESPDAGESDDKSSGPLLDQIRAMSAQQRMHLAAHGDRAARLILVKDPNKTIQTFLLQNKHFTIEEVRYLAASRQASPDALQTIAGNRDWVQNQGVVTALVGNPKTPLGAAVRLLDRLPETELRRVARSGNVPRGVQTAARKKLNL